MEQAIQLYCFLILTFLGLIAPIMAVLLAIFGQGVVLLTRQYENEKLKSENNIKEQLKKQGEAESTDLLAIKKSITKLESIKKKAQTQLFFLNPKRLLPRLFIILLISFLGGVSFFVTFSFYKVIVLLISIICFASGTFIIWKLLGIIVEAQKMIDDNKSEKEGRTVELLSKLAEKFEKGALSFLKDVCIDINDVLIKDDSSELNLECNKKHELIISVTNNENRMAKNVEVGFIFSLDFIIDKASYYTLVIDKERQIVRYSTDFIHGNTKEVKSPLIITPLKIGESSLKTFIKAENIESIYRKVKITTKGA